MHEGPSDPSRDVHASVLGDARPESHGHFEPIAIVGMACRFPGAPSLDDFWNLLTSGVNATFECPPGRNEGRVGALYADTAACPSACRFGAFLTDIDQFDAEFFRISPSEAEYLDPQQRMMLETSWRALENAGIDPEALRGSSASVYAGMSNNDYRYLILDGADTSQAAASLYTITGTSLNTAIGRVSYALGLEGPAMTVDTACSSSLVAMHEAIAALHREETDLALAGGVQLILSGKLTELRANAGMLSPDGTCKTFDESANGYVRGEGCGIVVLKRLSDAERDGDRIWAVVAASAINQDGTSDGLTVPRGVAQRAVIEDAVSLAGIQPSHVDYLEAHGTGTPVGDPIEVNAAAEVYGVGRGSENPLLIGSVKTNIGHLEPAAGVAGVIKAALAMKSGFIPKHLNFTNPNPAIDWDGLPVKVVTDNTPWPTDGSKHRYAGINSFGFSGTNAHVLLRSYTTSDPGQQINSQLDSTTGPAVEVRSTIDLSFPPARTKRFLPLSAKSPDALLEVAGSYARWLDSQIDRSENDSDKASMLADFAWTASTARSHHNYRHAIVFDDLDGLRAQLDTLSIEQPKPISATGGKIAFTFTGQGSQWVGMGRALYESEPLFREVIDQCEEICQGLRQTSLRDRIFGLGGDESDLQDPTWVQPGIYAVQCALTRLWQSYGVEPEVVLGHSLGEIAAAHTAGVWSFEDGFRFAAARGELMSQIPGPGGMAAVFISEDEAQSRVAEYNSGQSGVGVSVAALNGAHQVLSGLSTEIEPLLDSLESAEIRVRRLAKSPAYHSALVEPILDRLAEVVDSLDVSHPQLTLISNVSGQRVDGELLAGSYWRRHARQSVQYRKSVEAVADEGVDVVVEIGPNSVLGPMTEMAWPDSAEQVPIVLSSLLMPRETRPEIPLDGGFVESVAEAYRSGLDIDFRGLYAGEKRRKVSIPGYAFQRRRHWVESKRRRREYDDHPLLGSKLDTPRGESLYEIEVDVSDPSWLDDHRVYGRALMPGAFFGSMAASIIDNGGVSDVGELQLHSPMVFRDAGEDDTEERILQTMVDPLDTDDNRKFEIYSKGRADDEWTLHASGTVSTNGTSTTSSDLFDWRELSSSLTEIDVADYYRQKAARNISLGGPFRSLKSIWADAGQAVAQVSAGQDGDDQNVSVPPLLLDGCFQVMSAARESIDGEGSATYLPFGWEELSIYAPFPSTIVCHARLRDRDSAASSSESAEYRDAFNGDLTIYSPQGVLLGELRGFAVKRATRSALLSTVDDPSDLIYEVVWRNAPHPASVRRTDPLPELPQVKSDISPYFSYLTAHGVSPEDRYELLMDLERLSHAHVLSTFQEQGWRQRLGQTFTADTLHEEMGFEEEHRTLTHRIVRLLEEANVVVSDSPGTFRDAVDPNELWTSSVEDPKDLARELLAKHDHGQVELTLLDRFGRNLQHLLTGGADPLALLFDEDSLGAADLYKVAPISIASNRLLGDVIAQIVGDLPKNRLVRVVEVGAGTGATTDIVLAELDAVQLEYVYTDISPGFFAEAEQRLAGNGVDITYTPLDIENDPADQGFEPGSFDLVIAANVLHATRNLHESLTHCREMLAPGGILIALESLRGRPWQDLTFGFLDGWWRFNDAYRNDHAIASPDIWYRALRDSGFVDAHVFGSEHVTDDSGPLGSGTIVAKTSSEIRVEPGVWIIEPDDGQIAEPLCRLLTSLKQQVFATDFSRSGIDFPSDVCESVVDEDELVDLVGSLDGDLPLRGVIVLSAASGHGVSATTDQVADDISRVGSDALSLVRILMDAGASPTNGTWFVTRGAMVTAREREGQIAGSALWGFAKVVALEAPHLTPRLVDLDQSSASIDALTDEILNPSEETQIAYRDSARFVSRMVRADDNTSRLKLPEEPDWVLAGGDDGSLQDVRVVELPRRELAEKEVRVQVAAVGLNFSDVLVALNAQSADASMGLEFAGTVVETGSGDPEISVGQRVVGMGFGTFGPEVITHSGLVAESPDGFSNHELATIPIAFMTAALAFERAKLSHGDRVLIHAATGGVGLAALQLAESVGATVFATCSQPKQAFLKSLGVERVYDSRELSFSQEILDATDGEGVDVVLNSLTSEGFIEASLSCLSEGGRFIEIGRLDILTPEEMANTRPDVDYFILSLDEMKHNEPDLLSETFRPLMKRFESRELEPLIHSKWALSELGDALQFMGSANHIGKLTLTVPPLVHGQLRDDRTYLVTGGLGGIGCAVAEWLAGRGARHVALNGRRSPDEDAVRVIDDLRERGLDVQVKIADVCHATAVDEMLQDISATMPPLAGVFHSVGVLSDGALENQTWDRFEEVLDPKVRGAWQLHQATKHVDLDLFVLFSSVTGVMGNAGQANHAAANAFLDQLAAHRRAIGLPGQSIAWGAWSSIGEAAEQRERIEAQLEATGTGWIPPELGIKALDHLVAQDVLNPAVVSIDWTTFAQSAATHPPFYRDLLESADDADNADQDLLELDVAALRDVPDDARVRVLVPYLQQQLQSVLRLPSLPSPSVGFFDLGMDSLMAVELRNRLIRVFESDFKISKTAVFDYPNVDALATHLSGELGTHPDSIGESVAASASRPEFVDRPEVAVVGLACRLPGADNFVEFWRNLESGVDCISSSRGAGEFWKGIVGDETSSDKYIRTGGFISGLDRFDARFFRIRPIEARMMDPRQRLLLETTWEAIENAGMDMDSLRGGRVGVYAGLGGSEYRDLVNASGYEDNYLGTSSGMTAGRISYMFGLMGPSMSFDLACASSLVAVHEGLTALQRGEVDVALVSGVNAILSPSIQRFHREIGLLSQDGTCRAFDERANGYVRSEGCCVLVLKRLNDAEQAGDPIWSVVLGSAVNQNGASAGLTVPNGTAQEQVIRDAVALAGVDPSQVDYLEAHATGLPLSDPIEVRAASAVYSANRSPDRPLLLGSAKSMLGHLEWAAGIAGMIKVILSMNTRTIPAQTRFDKPSQGIDWDSALVRVNRTMEAWPDVGEREPLAAVSAFGMSGANAHVLLQGYSDSSNGKAIVHQLAFSNSGSKQIPIASDDRLPDVSAGADTVTRRQRLLPLSAKSPEALASLAEKYLDWIVGSAEVAEQGDQSVDDLLADVAWSAGVGRHHFDHRHAIVFDGLSSLTEALTNVTSERTATRSASKVAFVFGNDSRGLQFLAEELFASEPAFRGVVDQCAKYCTEDTQIDLMPNLFIQPPDNGSGESDQATLCAHYVVQSALVSYLESLGIRPDVVCGQGVGEFAAALAAGMIQVTDGIGLITQLNPSGGKDSSVPGNRDESVHGSDPSVSIVSPSSGGPLSSFDDFKKSLESLQWETGSSLVDEMQELAQMGVDCIVHFGHADSLEKSVDEAWANVDADVPTVVHLTDDSDHIDGNGLAISPLIRAVARAYEANLPIRFEGLFAGESRRRILLPTYPFERRSFWFNASLMVED